MIKIILASLFFWHFLIGSLLFDIAWLLKFIVHNLLIPLSIDLIHINVMILLHYWTDWFCPSTPKQMNKLLEIEPIKILQ